LAANHGNVAASEVYRDVRAVPKNSVLQECLADRDEIETARKLLSCVVQSLSQLRVNGGFANSILPAFSVPEVSVSIAKNLNKGFLVRKVSFDTANGHPAPDPMLLVLKAADSWTSLREIPMFRDVREQDDSDSESTGVMSLAAEAQMRGWPDYSHLCNGPPVNYVTFDDHVDEWDDDENYEWDIQVH
jgi:hypothetical protein